MMIARTDPDVPKHRGLSMFVVPMDAPGVTVRPLRLLSGAAGFNEVFFDDVHLDEGALLGPLDEGWAVATTTLMFERLALLAAFEQLGWGAEKFAEPLKDHPAIEDAAVRQRLADVATDLLSLRFVAYRTLTALHRGSIPGPEAGLSKITMIDAGIRAVELLVDVMGPEALEGQWGSFTAEIPALRTGGGTDEILRTMIGDRVLGLPPEPRVDKDKPFSELSASRTAVPA
jgi:alkylation response protein AidB-like acyl-CoA dehydrogenase